MRLWAAAFMLLIALACTEAVVRVTHFAGPFGMAYVRDSVIGHRLRPGFKTWFRGEGEAFFTVNNDGMPDAEHSVVKPANTFRIAVVGDSFTEAAGVSRPLRFTAVMQDRLASCPSLQGQRIEVLSFGVSAYGPAHELLAMRAQVRKYSPNVVLLQLFLGNDLRANLREFNGPEPMPFFVRSGRRLALDSASRHMPGPRRRGWLWKFESSGFKWIRSMQVVQAVRVKLRAPLPPQVVVPPRPANVADSIFGFEPGANWEIFLPPQRPGWEQSWQVMEGLLRMMKSENESIGNAFRVALFPSAIQVHPDPVKRSAYLASIGVTAFDYPASRLADIAQRHGIQVLDLAPPLLAYAEQHQVPLYGAPNASLGLGHWNQDGHRVGGEALARWLCQSLDAGAGVQQSVRQIPAPPEVTASTAARLKMQKR